MLANVPPFGFSQVHTFGDTYSDVSVIAVLSMMLAAREYMLEKGPLACENFLRLLTEIVHGDDMGNGVMADASAGYPSSLE